MTPDEPTGSRPGQHALAAGVAAAVGVFVPGFGELIALPAAALAVVLGLVGVRRYETGRCAHVVPAATGIGLGLLAALAVLLVALASRT